MTLRFERDGAIGRLIIDRPDKRNAFTQDMWDRFPVVLTHALADRAVRVIIVQSAVDGVFCAGADIGELLAHKANASWRAANQDAINKLQHDLARAGKPAIAFIDGDCIGGGCGIAMACDIRIATSRARFGITPANLGLVYPLHDTKLLVDLVGPGQANRILFSAQLFDAHEALRIGLIDEIAESADSFAQLVATKSTHSCHEIKLIIRRILDGQANEDAASHRVFAEAFTRPDFVEGASAFIEKRKPAFK
jgi:enoyl-CoA hydratase/carnithine racemase